MNSDDHDNTTNGIICIYLPTLYNLPLPFSLKLHSSSSVLDMEFSLRCHLKSLGG